MKEQPDNVGWKLNRQANEMNQTPETSQTSADEQGIFTESQNIKNWNGPQKII